MTGKEGYRYFGAAKDLPGVRELFFSEPPSEPKKSRTELYKVYLIELCRISHIIIMEVRIKSCKRF